MKSMNKDEVVRYVEEKLNDLFNYIIEKVKEIDENDPMFKDKLKYVKAFIDSIFPVFQMIFDPLPKIKDKGELKIYAQQILLMGKAGVAQGEVALKMLESESEEEG